uniref:Antitoxin n=1 Tax=viral metagenome TaxID=1070528 RepID=A0A6M3KU19_9ZZZZ
MRAVLYIEVDPEDKELFKEAADRERLTLTAWVRRIAVREARKILELEQEA